MRKRNGPHPKEKSRLGLCRVLLPPAPWNTVITGMPSFRALRPACFLLSGRDSPPPGRLRAIWTAAFQRPPGRPRVSRQGDIGGIYSGIYSGNAVAISPSVCGDSASWHGDSASWHGDSASWHGDFAICKLTPYRARISSLGECHLVQSRRSLLSAPFFAPPPAPGGGLGP